MPTSQDSWTPTPVRRGGESRGWPTTDWWIRSRCSNGCRKTRLDSAAIREKLRCLDTKAAPFPLTSSCNRRRFRPVSSDTNLLYLQTRCIVTPNVVAFWRFDVVTSLFLGAAAAAIGNGFSANVKVHQSLIKNFPRKQKKEKKGKSEGKQKSLPQ